jgi:hypothetical protein
VEIASSSLLKYADYPGFPGMAGIFLSAAISTCKSQDFIIHARDYPEPIGYVGMHNTKNVTVYGDLGDWPFTDMLGGKITVYGDTHGFWCLNMEGGIVKINGNICLNLKEGWSTPKGGEIYQKGRLLFKGGKIIAQPSEWI